MRPQCFQIQTRFALTISTCGDATNAGTAADVYEQVDTRAMPLGPVAP